MCWFCLLRVECERLWVPRCELILPGKGNISIVPKMQYLYAQTHGNAERTAAISCQICMAEVNMTGPTSMPAGRAKDNAIPATRFTHPNTQAYSSRHRVTPQLNRKKDVNHQQ